MLACRHLIAPLSDIPFSMETEQVLKHTLSLHTESLHSLCSVCGGRSKIRTDDICVKLCKHVSELAICLDIKILFDRSDIHSQTVCNKCYSRSKTIRKRSAVPSKTTLEHAKHLTEVQLSCGKNLMPPCQKKSILCAHSFFARQKKEDQCDKKRGRPKKK